MGNVCSPIQNQSLRQTCEKTFTESEKSEVDYLASETLTRISQSVEACRQDKGQCSVDNFIRTLLVPMHRHNWTLYDYDVAPFAAYLRASAEQISDKEHSKGVKLASILLPWAAFTACGAEEGRLPYAACNENRVREWAAELREELLKDGKLDDIENFFLYKFTLTFDSGATGEESLLGSYLLFFDRHREIGGDILHDNLIRMRDRRSGRRYTFLVNHGVGVSSSAVNKIIHATGATSRREALPWRQVRERVEEEAGHQIVQDVASTPLSGNYLGTNCFAAALCTENEGESCVAAKNPMVRLDSSYRMVSVGDEAVKLGDVLVYFSATNNLPGVKLILVDSERGSFHLRPNHTSVVTQIDAIGMPVEAVGKMGHGPIKRHPSNRVTLKFGPLIGVFRRTASAGRVSPLPPAAKGKIQGDAFDNEVIESLNNFAASNRDLLSSLRGKTDASGNEWGAVLGKTESGELALYNPTEFVPNHADIPEVPRGIRQMGGFHTHPCQTVDEDRLFKQICRCESGVAATTFSLTDMTSGLMNATDGGKKGRMILLDMGTKLVALVTTGDNPGDFSSWIRGIWNDYGDATFSLVESKRKAAFRKIFESYRGKTYQERLEKMVVDLVEREKSGVRLYETIDRDKTKFKRVTKKGLPPKSLP